MSNNNSSSGGIGLGGVLFVTFLVLKLTGVIGWSWWWITAPLWIPLGLVAIIGTIAIIWLAVAHRTYYECRCDVCGRYISFKV